MRWTEVLARLNKHGIQIEHEVSEANGSKTVVLATPLPTIPFGDGRMAYYTLNLSSADDEIELEDREAIRRHLWHLSTDIFGDDEAELSEILASECADSHIHKILPTE